MVSQNTDYGALALEVVERDAFYSRACNPEPEHVIDVAKQHHVSCASAHEHFMIWRGDVYKGSLQRFFDERPEIGFMTKSSHPYELELVEAIRKLEHGRQDFEVPDDFDISGTKYAVNIYDRKLLPPTEEQKSYFKKYGPKMIIDLDFNLGEV